MNLLSTKKVYLVGAVALALGIMFTVLFFDKLIGISLVIYVVLLLAGVFGLLLFFKVPYAKSSIWFVPAIIFFSSMVAVRDNEFLVFINCVMTFGLLLLLANQITGQKLKHNLFFDYVKTAVVLPLMMLGKAFNALGRMISVGKGTKESKKSSQITKGILITLPVFVFFLLLLSSADVAFKHLVTNIFSFQFSIDENVVPKIWWSLFFAVVWLGAYVFIFENATTEENPVTPVVRRYKFGNIESGILFGALNVLFLTFVGVQITYLFAGHEAITKLGYTYAEYAHKGFGELVFVAIFTFALIFLAERYIERTENKPSILFKSLTGVLMMLVLVIMVSAFMRLSVYEEAYGFTVQRVLVQAFIIWLVAVFLWLGYKIMNHVDDRRFVFGLFLSAIAFFAAFNLLNPDAFVTRKNIDQFAKTGKLDTTYLSTLSTDAVPELIPLLDMPGAKDTAGNDLSKEVAIALKKHHDVISNHSWQSYNISRSRAMEIIESKWEVITSSTPSYGMYSNWSNWLETSIIESPTTPVEAKIVFRCGVSANKIDNLLSYDVMNNGELMGVRFLIREGYFQGWSALPHRKLSSKDTVQTVIAEFANTFEMTTSDTGEIKANAVRNLRSGTTQVTEIDISGVFPEDLLKLKENESVISEIVPRLALMQELDLELEIKPCE